MWKWLKASSVQTLIILFAYMLLADSLPLEVSRGLYTLALCIKDILMWLMPLTVCFFLAYTVFSFKKKAPLFLVTIMIFEAISNFFSVWYAYGWGHITASYIPVFEHAPCETAFQPLWQLPFKLPSFWSASRGCLVGVVLGACGALFQISFVSTLIETGKKIAEQIMAKIFARLIPLFVLGFAVHMYHTNLLGSIVTQHGELFFWLVGILALYIFMLFVLGCMPHFERLMPSIRNLMPAGMVALTSSSSLSTMPWTIQGSAKNMENPQLAQAVIPATTNIQQIGDCITNAFICFMTYYHFYGDMPPVSVWLPFSVVFTLARFSTAAIIGGAIFVMLPIYEAYLQFTPEMLAIILALNVILDPLVTSTNVLANGALCRIFERVWKRIQPAVTIIKN